MKRKIKGGDCYYIAGQFAMDNVFSPKKIDYKGTPYLVHAEVQGQGKVSNLRYGHAWIEDDENVYDFSNGRELIIAKVLYYAIGDIRTNNPKKYQKYTFSEARKRMLQYKHYGCWDLDVEYKEGGNVRTPADANNPDIRYAKGGEVEFEDNRWDFNLGDCGLYAIALHRVYGFPIYVCKGYFLEEDWGGKREMEGEVSHAVVKLPNGNYLDHDGELTEKQLLKNTYYGSNNKEAKKNEKIEPVTEKQAKLLFRCGSEESRCPDMVKEKEIQEVVKYIMKKKFNKKYTDIRYEIGGIFQGTPHEFDKYSTDYMGTGEGQQVFGWGLYFTDIKDIAKQYAKNELLIEKEIAKKSNDSAHLWIYSNVPSQVKDKLAYLKNELNDLEEKQSQYPKLDLADKIKTYRDLIDIIENYKGKVYSVTLFKGENESDYDLLLWDSPVNIEQLEKIFIEAEKIGGIPLKEGWYFSTTKQDELTPELLKAGYSTVNLYNERALLVRGHSLYNHLSNELGSDKEASLFLLRAGIDGIKYKSGTLSGMEDKEGYNYVIFDADDATIENKELYKNGGLTMKKPKAKLDKIEADFKHRYYHGTTIKNYQNLGKVNSIYFTPLYDDAVMYALMGNEANFERKLKKSNQDVINLIYENPKELLIKLFDKGDKPIILIYETNEDLTNNYEVTFPNLKKSDLEIKHIDFSEFDKVSPIWVDLINYIPNTDWSEGGHIEGFEDSRYAQGGGLDKIEVKIIEDDSLAEKVYNIIEDDLSVAVPRLALIENDKVIGGIYLEPANSYVLDGKRTVEPLSEYKFDIYIKISKRKKGYSKLLLDAMIKDFIYNFPDAEQIRGEVINKKLEKSLQKNYGFNCDSGNQEEITYCYLSRESAIKYLKRRKLSNGGTLLEKEKKDIICSSCGWGWNKHQSEESDVYICHKCGTDNNPADNILKIEQVEIKLGRKLHWWNDDIVYLSGIKYKKVYLRPEYKVI
jgi:hypothetical protein